ncbi:MAG: hypothetical protein ABIH23_08815 [bacterium]
MATKRKKGKGRRKRSRTPYWATRADKGICYILVDIDWDAQSATVIKQKAQIPIQTYRIVDGACDCQGFQFRQNCSHVDFLSCVVDSIEVPMVKARAVCHVVVEARDFKTMTAEVLEADGLVYLLHIKAKMLNVPEMRIVEWYGGLAVVTDINPTEIGGESGKP